VYYALELGRLERAYGWLQVAFVYTRVAAPQTARPPGRVRAADLAPTERVPAADTRVYVCGPTGFVESVTTMLVEQGYQQSAIRTERFGPSQ
jgi:ferredoxin-NADP reductase